MTVTALPLPIKDRINFLSKEKPRKKDGNGEKLSECPTPITFGAKLFKLLDYRFYDNPPARNSGTFTIDCNRKSCPYCSEKNRKKLVAHYTRIYSAMPNVSVLTLTIDPKVFPSIRYSRHFLVDTWSLYRKRINRELKKRKLPPLVFTMMLERTEVGRYHAHVITNIDLPYQIIQDHWMDCGGGISMYYDRDIPKDMIPRVVGYNVKYIFKKYDSTKYERALMNSLGISINSKAQKEIRLEAMAEQLNSSVKETSEGKKFIDKQPFEKIQWKYDLPESIASNQQYDLQYVSPYSVPNYKYECKGGHKMTVIDMDTGEIIREYDRMSRVLKKWLRDKRRIAKRRNKIKFKDKKTGKWYDLEYGKEPQLR
ncbi:MAG: hypothetical protein RLN81_12650 [Balneolaceae bacterium]